MAADKWMHFKYCFKGRLHFYHGLRARNVWEYKTQKEGMQEYHRFHRLQFCANKLTEQLKADQN
jgi:hypothetical protein